jgi:hypothetical protein
MSKKSFVLHDGFENPLSDVEFRKIKTEYLTLINQNQYSVKATNNIHDMIRNVKRSPENIGPYKNISVFEALNRIGSDLVLLDGAERLFNGEIDSIKPKSIQLNMGNKHGFDFTVTLFNGIEIYGEAFNAAESFCKDKCRQAIDKLANEQLDEWHKTLQSKAGILFINEEVKPVIDKYENQKEKELREKGIKIHKVYCNL